MYIFIYTQKNNEAKRILFASMLNNSVKKNRTEIYKNKLKVKIHTSDCYKPHFCVIFISRHRHL